jgi:DNA (cytosine-5)-methyltransferase 1
MSAIYNEIEPYACDWLESLIAKGHIANGRVERRSIRELQPSDVGGGGQRHFFAGIGLWSHALRLAGVPDDASVWTGSCPCQPFSVASVARRGTDDERHLWPEWFRLIRECRPAVVFGEQVANGGGLGWLDGVFSDLEGAGYACAAADLCAAGVGAPHVRQRLYFMAHASGARLAGPLSARCGVCEPARATPTIGSDNGVASWLRVHADQVPTESADGFPRPVGFVRACGNAIVPQVAATFIRAALEAA